MMSLKIYNDKIQIYKNLKVIYNVIIILLPVVNTIIRSILNLRNNIVNPLNLRRSYIYLEDITSRIYMY